MLGFVDLKAVGLKVNFDKCVFLQPYLQFLGQVVGRDRIRSDNRKVEKVRNFPAPTNLQQLCGFIGLALYYQKFIANFASIACPLHHLLKKDVKYKWKQEQEDAFKQLKSHFTEASILRYPDFDKTFIIHTDASGIGLGAMLAQKDDHGKEYVVAYMSRSLTKPEKNYSTTELECLAVLWAVEYFCHYFGLDPFFGCCRLCSAEMATNFGVNWSLSSLDSPVAAIQF
ncbi:15262_t:CDS:2 [Dentiscutata erythropus]|uniref:15262_t:CDS:1 n=1 Tax=Dentiscutata erythropus TaxID=1348616 RepID=A0A9N9BLI1_9GLOM|nr:15262_t:CDS:2 [Dentiscutata erythropus]